MSIVTKTGDKGSTALLFGRRVSKTDLRIDCNGGVDELNASLGMARAHLAGTVGDPFISGAILVIQKRLIDLMGEIATAAEDRERHREAGFSAITSKDVDGLTAQIDELESTHKINFQRWATPGDTLASGALDVARTVCRRAERLAVAVQEGDASLNPDILRYLNRLSDLCWLWARWVETQTFSDPVTEV